MATRKQEQQEHGRRGKADRKRPAKPLTMCLPDRRDFMGGEIANGFHKRATTSARQQVFDNWRTVLRREPAIDEVRDEELVRTVGRFSVAFKDAGAPE